MRRVVLALALAAGICSIATAQPRPAAQQKRERIKQRIQALRAYMLVQQLGLDEATSNRVLIIFAKFDEEYEKLLAARVDLHKRLVATSDKDPKATIDKLIDDALANQRAFWDTDARRLAELRKNLTPAQTAKLLVVLPALERNIQNQLRKAIRAGARGKPAAHDDDGDDDDDEDAAPAPRPAVPPPAGKKKPCDPFDTLHGC